MKGGSSPNSGVLEGLLLLRVQVCRMQDGMYLSQGLQRLGIAPEQEKGAAANLQRIETDGILCQRRIGTRQRAGIVAVSQFLSPLFQIFMQGRHRVLTRFFHGMAVINVLYRFFAYEMVCRMRVSMNDPHGLC